MKKWTLPLCTLAVLLLGSTVAYQYKHHQLKDNDLLNSGSSNWENSADTEQAEQQASVKMTTFALDRQVNRLHNAITVNTVQQCDAAQPRVEIDSALLAQLDQEKLKQGIISAKGDYDIRAHFAQIRFFSAQPVIDAESRGTADLTIDCPADTLTVSNRGTGNIEIQSASALKRVAIDNIGTGDVKLGDAQSVQIDSKGTGSVSLGLVQTANVSLYGTGDVSFANSPQITSSIKGIGKIRTNVAQ